MSRDQYSHMRQQFCGVNDYCDARGSIYPKIKIMAVWRQIHHAGHTPPRNHDLPHLCDFPDVMVWMCVCFKVCRLHFACHSLALALSEKFTHVWLV